MITNTHLGSYGRLGNQLFQYAILLVVGDVNNYEVKIPKLEDKHHHGQKCLLNNFNITAKTLTSSDVIEHYYKESVLDYDPSVFDVPDNCDLLGYFGHYKYLRNHEEIVIRELTPNIDIMKHNQNNILKIKEKYSEYIIVSLHIRRGDVLGSSDILFLSYISDAKKIFKNKKCKFLVFTGGSRDNNNEDSYKWCKNNLKGDEYIYCADILDDYKMIDSPINDFAMMILSDAHILSPTSTLSWWVGFLDKKNEKITVAPKKWWYLSKEMSEEFYPDNFILI